MDDLKKIYLDTAEHLKVDSYLDFLRHLVRVTEPKQIVEFGAYKGLSAAMMMDFLPEDGHLYSVDARDTSWTLLKDHFQLTKVVGDDNDINTWKDVQVDLGKTDLWYIDSWHDDEHVFKTLEVYTPYFKKGALLVFDDIITIPKVWETLPYDKIDISPHHYPGFGIAKV